MNGDANGPVGWVREIVLNCPDPWDLARFWARLLGGTPVEWYPGWVTLQPPPHGQRFSFQGMTSPSPWLPALGSWTLGDSLSLGTLRVRRVIRENGSQHPAG
jgi:hypothetical protein